MGIPRLRSLLEPYYEATALGCSKQDCTTHTNSPKQVIIDGPALAYIIYYRLLAYKPITLNAIDAQPNYDEIGGAVLIFLHALTHCGIKMYTGGSSC